MIRSKLRRRRVGRVLTLAIEAESVEKTFVARDMEASRTALHNVLEGRTRVNAGFAVRLAASLEACAIRANPTASTKLSCDRVRRRALEFLRLQSELDLDEALAEPAVRELLGKLQGRLYADLKTAR